MKLTERQIARVHALANARGQVTPTRVVEDAKKKGSPLHALFLWDVKGAAHRHWLHRAREIIGAVTVVTTTKNFVVKAPFFVREIGIKGQGYRSVAALRADPDAARDSLVFTLEVAAGHLRRAYDLAEPLGLSQEIDALLTQVTGLQQTLRTEAA